MKIELYKDRKGEWRWRARHTNGRILADSGEGYKRKGDALKGLRRLAVSLGPAVERMS